MDLVSAVFAYQGFAVLSTERRQGEEASGVLVRRGPLEIAIAVVPGSASLDEGRLKDLLAALAEREGARHLIAYAGQATAAVRAAAAAAGTVLWDRERMLAEVGAAFVGTADPDPFGAPGAVPASLSIASSPPGADAGRGRPARGWRDAPGRGASTIAPARAADSEALLGAVPLKLDGEHANAAAQRLLRAPVLRSALEWVPSYLVEFHLEVEVRTPRGEEGVLHAGSLLVSATGGEVEEVDHPLEVVAPEAVLGPADLAKAMGRRRLGALEARERARQDALARAQRTVESVQERGTVVVTERHAWRPKGSHVDLVVRGLLLVPLYLAETEHGLASINGATGKALRVAPFVGDGPA